MAKYNSPIGVSDVSDKKVREALLKVMENCEYLKQKVDEQARSIELLKRKAV